MTRVAVIVFPLTGAVLFGIPDWLDGYLLTCALVYALILAVLAARWLVLQLDPPMLGSVDSLQVRDVHDPASVVAPVKGIGKQATERRDRSPSLRVISGGSHG